jgi:hypothetical protein
VRGQGGLSRQHSRMIEGQGQCGSLPRLLLLLLVASSAFFGKTILSFVLIMLRPGGVRRGLAHPLSGWLGTWLVYGMPRLLGSHPNCSNSDTAGGLVVAPPWLAGIPFLTVAWVAVTSPSLSSSLPAGLWFGILWVGHRLLPGNNQDEVEP